MRHWIRVRHGIARRALGVVIGLGVGLAAPGCADPYNNNDFLLLTAYTAKEMCSCLFVMEQTQEFCTAFTKANPNIKSVRVDLTNKRVESEAVLLYGARARYTGPRTGCILE